MAFNSNANAKQVFEYSPDDTFSALKLALEKSSHYSIKESSASARTISISTGVSWKSWGENLLITVSPVSGGYSEVSISSSSKYGLVDWGKNQNNLNQIFTLLSAELQQFDKVTPAGSTDDIPAQIKKLAQLKDEGIITEDEFQDKKTKLLAKM